MAVEVEKIFAEDAKARQREHGRTAPGKKNTSGKSAGSARADGEARAQAAEALNVSPRLVQDAKKVATKGAQNCAPISQPEAAAACNVAARVANLGHGGDRSKLPIGSLSRGEAAGACNVGERTVARAAVVLTRGAPELVRAVDAGHVPVAKGGDA